MWYHSSALEFIIERYISVIKLDIGNNNIHLFTNVYLYIYQNVFLYLPICIFILTTGYNHWHDVSWRRQLSHR